MSFNNVNQNPEFRRRAMQANRGRTRPELRLARALWARGLRYVTAAGYRSRTGVGLVGQPDLVFGRKRIVVLLDGCFWHGCPEHRGVPTGSGEFWRTKIERNKARDVAVTAELSRDGWRVIRVWEHDVKTNEAAARKAQELAPVLEAA